MELHLKFFKDKLHDMGPLSPEDWFAVGDKVEFRTLKSGQLLTGLGVNEYYFMFVCQGMFRELDMNNLGEFVLNRYLLPESVFIGVDPATRVRIEAISDGVILLLSERDVLTLESEQWAFRKLFRLFLIRYMRALQLRGDILSCKTAKIKYHFFYKYYKLVCESVPLSEQAAYLNLNKDTVCRIKAKH